MEEKWLRPVRDESMEKFRAKANMKDLILRVIDDVNMFYLVVGLETCNFGVEACGFN